MSPRAALASMAAMRRARKIVAIAVIAAASAGAVGCGDNSNQASIPPDDAQQLIDKLDEIRSNIDQGSCFVASDKTDEFVSEVEALPSDVNGDVKQALESGAANLQNLLADPNECQTQTDTTTETTTTETTEPSTSTRETTTQTQPTETQQTQTQQTQTNGGGSGGVGPGGLESP